MKKGVTVLITICFVAAIVILSSSQKALSYSVTTQGIATLLNEATSISSSIYVKFKSQDTVEFFEIALNSKLENILNIERWSLASENVPTDSYIVLRFGEGYEIVLYNNHTIYVEDTYALAGTYPSACYITEGSITNAILAYIKSSGIPCYKIESMFIN